MPNDKDRIVVECPNCHKEEYWGMMYYANQKLLCRRCFKKMTNNGEEINFFFPKYEDGVDYTVPMEETNAS